MTTNIRSMAAPPALTVAYLGNYSAPHSTENHVKQAFERNGHTVIPLQENTPEPWTEPVDADLVLWTRTGWDWSEACGWTQEQAWSNQHDFLDRMRDQGTPTVGFHLDRWWGLDREHQIFDEPFFRCDLMCTADGGHDDQWQLAGINHVWMPPGVSWRSVSVNLSRDRSTRGSRSCGSGRGSTTTPNGSATDAS